MSGDAAPAAALPEVAGDAREEPAIAGAAAAEAEEPDPVLIPPTREWLLSDLLEADYNPREISEEELLALSDSIDEFGLVEDLVVNVREGRRGVVIGGHQRLKILRIRGVLRAPCKEVDLSIERERELNVRLNANRGRFSARLLLEHDFDRTTLEEWGLSTEDLAAFDREVTVFERAAEGATTEPAPEPSWDGMPAFEQEDLAPKFSVIVHFKNQGDLDAFCALVDQKVTAAAEDARYTRSIWFPRAEIGRIAGKRYRTAAPVLPRHPIYVPSKGRWESRLTMKALEAMDVPYKLVVEREEVDAYAAVVGPQAEILVLPESGRGLVFARNWIKRHSTEAGDARHWQLDDNIRRFYRLHQNLKTPAATGAIFRAVEDFSDRFTNVGISGLNYFMFAPRKSGDIRPFTLNTRVYSCSLVSNAIPHGWRAVYNDDTDICLRVLKDGLCTILFNAFLCEKSTTMTVKGGNTDIYQGAGRLRMAESLQRQHPDVVKITRKWQHHVDYRPFKPNRLIPRPDLVLAEGPDDYGMWLEDDQAEVAGQVLEVVAAGVQDPDEEEGVELIAEWDVAEGDPEAAGAVDP